MRSRNGVLASVLMSVLAWLCSHSLQSGHAQVDKVHQPQVWEYKVVSTEEKMREVWGEDLPTPDTTEDVLLKEGRKRYEAWLNRYGQQGWELCSSGAVFKRRQR